MAIIDPDQQPEEEIRSLQSRIGELQEKVHLADNQGSLSEMNTGVNDLVSRLAGLRTRGTVSGKDLENQAQALLASWGQLNPSVQSQITSQSAELIEALLPLDTLTVPADRRGGEPGCSPQPAGAAPGCDKPAGRKGLGG